MNLSQLKKSERDWKRKHTYRQARLRVARAANRRERIDHWTKLRDEASWYLRRRREQIREHTATPPIVTSAQLGLKFQYVFGTKGHVNRGAWHYTAGARRANRNALVDEMRSDHAYHISKGWGGGSYEAMIADDGTIGFLNPVARKSAGVAGHNSGLVNICCPGTTGDRLSDAQKRSLQWLRDNWHTTKVPTAYRLPRSARSLSWRGHNEYPGNPTGCPGAMLADYKRTWAS